MFHPYHKLDSEGNPLPDMINQIGMMVLFMVIVFHAMDMVIELYIAGEMSEEMLVGPTTRSDVGHVACLAMLLLYVTP